MDIKEKGMQKKMFIGIAAAAVVAVTALVMILALGRKEETYRSIKIIELKGGVTIEREGVGTLEASSNMNLISGDAVKTGQNAYAVLQLDSDKYVMLAESGSMTVVAEGDEANGRTAIRLDSGSVLNEIQNPLSNGSSYDIVTPNATMSVRGTVFEVRKNGDDSTGDIEVLVYDGKVAVGLDGMESALYEAGEYTQFTAGQDPQYIVERTEIAEENLNPQFMERLEQIDSQSRELNLGTAQLASAQTQDEAVEPQQTPAVTAPAATPAQTEAPATPAPGAMPAATPKPTKTPAPQAAVQTPEVTAAPVETPVVEVPAPENSNDDDDQPAPPAQPVQPEPPAQNPGENNNSKYQDLWKTYTMAVYGQNVADNQQSVSDGNAGTKECTVVFYIPYVVKTDDNGVSTMRNDAPAVYSNMQVSVGSLVTEPQKPFTKVNYSETLLQFEGWCLEDGTVWNFSTDTVKADVCLYPIWSTNNSADWYFPVICRSAENWGHYHYCNSVKKSSSLAGIDLSDNGGAVFKGWERINQDPSVVWDPKTDTLTIQGTESLKAIWQE